MSRIVGSLGRLRLACSRYHPFVSIYCILLVHSGDTQRLPWRIQGEGGLALSGFEVLAILAIGFQSFLLFLALFEPSLRYKVSKPPSAPLDTDEFDRILATLADSALHKCTSIEVLTNGENFYEAELQAIAKAQRSVNMEAYIFQKGEVTRRFVEALTERAKAGVKVNIVLDAIGSFATWNSYFKELKSRRRPGRVVSRIQMAPVAATEQPDAPRNSR